ncbi:hypothetical protein F441_14587 [Phytophthora nicotianae CJ01A1]|uniref:Uncharacterized protein n=1 Tax=Phytophthora nicotianae CJ01A1 TaxID=1317063 RepID=W2WGB9_PHYNI|nr:hypothetical protein F441_14587 [Phytophthora nicotianae CJ01A1]
MNPTAETRRCINTLLQFLIENNCYTITLNDNYSINETVQVLIHEDDVESLISDRRIQAILMENGIFVADEMLALSNYIICVLFIVENDPFRYVRDTRFGLLKFSSNGIFDYSRISKQTWPHHETMAMALYHPRRIEKWIQQGKDLEEYLN